MSILHINNLQKAALDTLELLYVYEEKPGITRRRVGRGFCFICPEGKTIKCPKEKGRLMSIAVPPTYENVWYCPLPNGHLQATGYDSRAKKQYFYHEDWARLREATKFGLMSDFADALPSFRRKIAGIINNPDQADNQERVLAAMFRILDKTGMRIGSPKAVKTNKTYGLTTLKKQHVDEDGETIHFEFKGKGGRMLAYDLRDARVADILQECEDIPGQHLCDYLDEDGDRHIIQSSHINAYIKDHMGEAFSAKDFRTWRFSCLFLEEALRQARGAAKVTLTKVLKNVAELSGNTPAILKASYIHPGLLAAVKKQNWKVLDGAPHGKAGLLKTEAQLLAYTKSRHAQQALS